MEELKFIKLNYIEEEIKKMSHLATSILRDYYNPLLGKAQNDYMLDKFQSISAIKNQLNHNYIYYFIRLGEINIGFLAYYKKNNDLYLSKLYLVKEYRGKGYARIILDFLINKAKEDNLKGIELNVNKYNETRFIYERLGFKRIRDEVNDIGSGYVMDDYVYYYDINKG